MKKRLISLLLCLIMAVSLFSGFAMADELPENGWTNIFGPWMYRVDGEWYYGWLYDNGYWYYLYDGPTMGDLWASYGPGMDQGWMLDDTFLVKNGRAYYFDASGKMVTGWNTIDGKAYYFDGSGRLQNGWISVPGYADTESGYTVPYKNYYYVQNGKIQTGWEYVDGIWYYLNPETGIMADDGWQEINGIWYYLKSWGGMDTGWLWYEDAWYYLKSWGGMAADEWEKVNGKWYLFDEEGKMLTGWQGQYYLTSSGAMETGWGYIDGNWYYFGSDGAMKTGWQKVSGKWYYMDPATGVMQTGWLVDSDGKRYYLSDSGAMLTGTQTIDGVEYIFNRSGALIS